MQQAQQFATKEYQTTFIPTERFLTAYWVAKDILNKEESDRGLQANIASLNRVGNLKQRERIVERDRKILASMLNVLVLTGASLRHTALTALSGAHPLRVLLAHASSPLVRSQILSLRTISHKEGIIFSDAQNKLFAAGQRLEAATFASKLPLATQKERVFAMERAIPPLAATMRIAANDGETQIRLWIENTLISPRAITGQT